MEKLANKLSIILFFLFFIPPLLQATTPTPHRHNITAVFALGDSTLDSGNNNRFFTFVRADHPPYGSDFLGGVATGRFSNGRLITDFLVDALGLKPFLPPSREGQPFARDMATGVSFASAGSGLDDVTAMNAMVETMSRQLNDFARYAEMLSRSKGRTEAARILREAVFVIGAGSNDLMMNYYMFPTRKIDFPEVSQYHNYLLQRLKSIVEKLYRMGARKLTIAGLPPLGCLPFQMTMSAMTPGKNFGLRICVDQQNKDSVAYNAMLQDLLKSMQESLQGTKFAYVDIYNPLYDMMKNPSKYGFVETTKGCCGTGQMEMGPMCSFPAQMCSDPSKFMFWDSVHPSQATYKALADEFMKTVLPKIMD